MSEGFDDDTYDEAVLGPRPPCDDFYGAANSLCSTSVPGIWTVDGLEPEPSPVPLPAAAPMLLIGAAALAGAGAIRRRV